MIMIRINSQLLFGRVLIMGGTFKLLLYAIIMTAALSCTYSASAESYLPKLGGDGGSDFNVPCPSANLVGVTLRAGDDVDGIGPICARVNLTRDAYDRIEAHTANVTRARIAAAPVASPGNCCARPIRRWSWASPSKGRVRTMSSSTASPCSVAD